MACKLHTEKAPVRHNNIRRIGDAHTLQRYHSEQRILDLLSGESSPPARPRGAELLLRGEERDSAQR